MLIEGVQPATLNVSVRTEFKVLESLYLKRIWEFKSEEQQPASWIHGIRVWENADHRISVISVVFNSVACEFMQERFKGNFKHEHTSKYCELTVGDPKMIEMFVRFAQATQQFTGESQTQMEIILSALDRQNRGFIQSRL